MIIMIIAIMLITIINIMMIIDFNFVNFWIALREYRIER